MPTSSTTNSRPPRPPSTLVGLLLIIAGLTLGFIATSKANVNDTSDLATPKPAPWTLWQLPADLKLQNMSYVLQTSAHHLIVIDGGWENDGPKLAAFLQARGIPITAWFITHPHPDHCAALTWILSSPSRPLVPRVYASLPTEDFVRHHEPANVLPYLKLVTALTKTNTPLTNLKLGESFLIDDLRVDVLSIYNPEIHTNALNNSSLVFKITGKKSILFLGDLGVEGGNKLLASPRKKLLHADYVQMSHHGQGGVTQDFYRAIAPTYCLWPTPKFLWENDFGKGPNTGPWKTLETRAWMQQLHVRKNYVSMDGLIQITE